ncbi:MAG: hypothetical protein WC478_05280 [Candidatus Omnitrophota bacterium]
MRQAQSAVEYIFLIGLVAATLVAMLVYMKRGFQGNLRQLAEQTGAGAYDPVNTAIEGEEEKHTVMTITSSSSSTVITGRPDGSTPDLTTSKSENTESGTETVSKEITEKLGNFSADAW